MKHRTFFWAMHSCRQHGTSYANFSVNDCGLKIGLGACFDNRVTSKKNEGACNALAVYVDIGQGYQVKSAYLNVKNDQSDLYGLTNNGYAVLLY